MIWSRCCAASRRTAPRWSIWSSPARLSSAWIRSSSATFSPQRPGKASFPKKHASSLGKTSFLKNMLHSWTKPAFLRSMLYSWTKPAFLRNMLHIAGQNPLSEEQTSYIDAAKPPFLRTCFIAGQNLLSQEHAS